MLEQNRRTWRNQSKRKGHQNIHRFTPKWIAAKFCSESMPGYNSVVENSPFWHTCQKGECQKGELSTKLILTLNIFSSLLFTPSEIFFHGRLKDIINFASGVTPLWKWNHSGQRKSTKKWNDSIEWTFFFNFFNFSSTCDIWDTDYNTDNWEPGIMTIFV